MLAGKEEIEAFFYHGAPFDLHVGCSVDFASVPCHSLYNRWHKTNIQFLNILEALNPQDLYDSLRINGCRQMVLKVPASDPNFCEYDHCQSGLVLELHGPHLYNLSRATKKIVFGLWRLLCLTRAIQKGIYNKQKIFISIVN